MNKILLTLMIIAPLVTSFNTKACSDLKIQPLNEPVILKLNGDALNFKVEGTDNILVTIDATVGINKSGKITKISQLKVSPGSLSKPLVQKILNDATFKPATMNGEPSFISNHQLNLEFEVQPKTRIKIDLDFGI